MGLRSDHPDLSCNLGTFQGASRSYRLMSVISDVPADISRCHQDAVITATQYPDLQRCSRQNARRVDMYVALLLNHSMVS
jgi:hypothetical protein